MKRSFLVTKWLFIWLVLLSALAFAGVFYDDLVIQSIFVVISLLFAISLIGSVLVILKRDKLFRLEPSHLDLALEAGQYRFLTINLHSSLPLWPWKVEIELPSEDFLWVTAGTQNLTKQTLVEVEVFGIRRGYLEESLSVIVKDPLEIFHIKVRSIFMKAECYPSFDAQDWLLELKARVEGDVFPTLGSDSGDPLKLRQYQPGDPLKRIAWKLFAKRSELICRVLEPADDQAKTVILYSYLLPEDEIAAAISLKIAEVLQEEDFSLLYSTNLSNDITPDFGQFKREVLNSNKEAPRKSLDTFLAKFQQISFNRQVLLIYSEDEQNLKIFSEIDRFFMKDQIIKVPCPKTVEQKRILDLFVEPSRKIFQPASNLELKQ